MSQPSLDHQAAHQAVQQALLSLRLVSIALPHLSGLAALVRVQADVRIPTAGIFASGRMVVNPAWLLSLKTPEATFVIAHELLHLALRSHERGQGIDPHVFNLAHDYIINDILVEVLGGPIPAGGLEWPGARDMSAEEIAQAINTGQAPSRLRRSWATMRDSAPGTPSTTLGNALQGAGLVPPGQQKKAEKVALDVLDETTERGWFPGTSIGKLRMATDKIREAAQQAAALGAFRDAMREMLEHCKGLGTGGEIQMVEAMRTGLKPAWEGALQRWFDSVVPGTRTYSRPSRRGADRRDVVLVGHRREGWILNVVLDTSGSMSSDIARLLGDIGTFSDAAGVDAVRVLQCDTEVTSDEIVQPDELSTYPILGYGGSDMSPALDRLAEEVEVESVIVLTDGYIEVPECAPPYAVLWVLTAPNDDFAPGYGQILVGAQ